MIYPSNFEEKLGFGDIRALLSARCLSPLGVEQAGLMAFTTQPEAIRQMLAQTAELRRLLETEDQFPLQFFFDLRTSLARIRLEGTYLSEAELFDLRRSLDTAGQLVGILRRSEGEGFLYPVLQPLTEGVGSFPEILRGIDRILDKFGKMRDTASPALADIRSQLARTQSSISRTLLSILHTAQSEGVVEKDAAPTLRDGRLVIPVAPAMKRRLPGIVHDESMSGKTVFVEPAEVVEANNRIRELESEERREVIRILTAFTATLRPHTAELLSAYDFLGRVDFLRAKVLLAELLHAIEPAIADQPQMDWIQAKHPLLQLSLEKQGKPIMPLDITLTPERHLLIISGPNAGGKSVCLKTVGLLQYMLQCGLSVPMSERSKAGVFSHIMVDIGDEQSIENDLSTYSSHLLNMKNMIRTANDRTLLLIDEFGTGTEPQIGGAIAEAVLQQFSQKRAFGVITTHYQNLKHFADSHPGTVNRAMLYDRHQMQPLFQLAIGQPGSSFAIEIARKIGLPESVIAEASAIVGTDYIQSDKYLQDIVRDKRYWEGKRQTVHQREKDLERTIARYEQSMRELDQKRREVLHQAKQQAEELLSQSNRTIENTIREIRECQAEREETKRIRQELSDFRQELSTTAEADADDFIARKMRQLQERKERKEKRRREKSEEGGAKREEGIVKSEEASVNREDLKVGDTVRIRGLSTMGTVESIGKGKATVVFGAVRSTVELQRLEHAAQPARSEAPSQAAQVSRATRNTIDERRKGFHQDLDVRGMRGDEALQAVMYFIDDAILVAMPRVRILHGKGNGILRQLIRQYLATVPGVATFRDEHVQFGGAGITVVDME